ncbi:hypothetical protein K438DRAFT_708928 [Mycena galopus ATCC 62051]|nr:hypothetical protein K438DRAFT_708928 [Mycena galopus ATCC 62051]
MTRDESIYSESERFNPDRFFTADGKLNDDDVVLAFGFPDLIVRWSMISNIFSLASVGAYAWVVTSWTR